MKNIYLLTYFKALLLFVVGLMCSYQLYGQTFMENFDDDPAFNVTSKDFTNDGIRYQINGLSSNYTNATSNSTFSLSEDGAADYALQFDKGGSFNINSIVISLGSGQVFSLQSLSFDIIADANITFSTNEGGSKSFPSNGVYSVEQNYDFSSESGFSNITSFTISGGNITVDLDDIVYSIPTANTAPTASSFTASNGPYENLVYTFAASDFGYSDADGTPLNHVLIESVAGTGTLFLDGDNDDTFDGGEAVVGGQQISKASLDAGNLQYIQAGSTNTSFQFEVNDGTDNSSGNYTATLNVTPVPTVTLSVSPTSKYESLATATTVTATLSNSYGMNTTVGLSTGGTATNSVDYSLSNTTITVPAGSTTGSVTLNNIPDALYEMNETIIIDINTVTGGLESGTQQVTYTILDDDPPPNATLEVLDYWNPITNEAGGQAYVRGKLDHVAGVTVTVPLSFSGTATGGGTDYAVTGSTITLSPGELMDSVRVTSLHDGVEEGDETVVIDMETPTNAVESGTQQVTLTIKDANMVAPTGYSVTFDQANINAANQTAASFTFAGAEVGADYAYTFTSSGGGTNVTGSGSVATATDQITGIDLSGLGDGTVTLSVTLTDGFGNTGSVVTDTNTKDTSAPSGYSASMDQANINAANQTAASFTFAGAEVGADYAYTFTSSGGGTNVTGSGSVATATDQITGIDLSGLGDGTVTLSVTLTDGFGNTGSVVTDTNTKDTSAPSGYSASMDQANINAANQSAASFTFAGAEVGADYAYTFTSSGGGTNVTGSGTVATATDQITGIDLSGLGDGTVTLSVTLTDGFGNTGSVVTDTNTKDTSAPSSYSVTFDQANINAANQSAASFTFAGAEVGADYAYTFTSSGGGTNVTGSGTVATATDQITGIDLSGLGDGTVTLSVTLTDGFGNTGSVVTDTNTKDTSAPSGYSVTLDQPIINRANQSAVSFTFSGAEVGTTYDYELSSSGGGTPVSGTGTVSSSSSQVTGINVSVLGDGIVTLSMTLTDSFGNQGASVSDTSTKETNEAPTVSGLSIKGVMTVGETLSADYTFNDADGDAENGTVYQWYRADDNTGTGKSAIPTANNKQYSLQAGDRGKFLSVEVTPGDGQDAGTTVESTLEGPVKADQSITFGGITPKAYGDATFTLGDAQTDQGLEVTYVADDPSMVSINGNQATILNAGTTQITASQSGDQTTNAATPVVRNLTINTATLTVTAEDQSKVYGGVDPALTVTYAGFVNGDDETALGGSLKVSRAMGEDVGDYAITASGYTSPNYTITYTAGTFEITPAALTVTAAEQSKVYGSVDPALTVTYAGFVNGDDETALGGTLTVSRTTGEDVGTYAITAAGYTSPNYTVTYTAGTFEITPAALTVTAEEQSKVYGSADPALTVTYAGFVNGDDETALGGSLTVSRAAGEDVGDYAITASGHTSTNYTINYASGTFEITPAALKVTAEDQSKVYGSMDPALPVTYAGFVNGDDETALGGSLKVTRATGEDVGGYAITASGYTSPNYTITYTAGTFEITPAALTVTAADQSKIYGSADPALTVSYAGFMNGDDETALGGSLTVSRATGEDVGDYAITASGHTSTNYTINYASGTFEITPAALTVTAADQSKVYGSMDPAMTVTYAGFVNGDDETALGGSLTLSRATGEDVGDYTITASGYTSPNYTVTYAAGTFEITPAALTVTAADQAKVYGSMDPALTVTYAGFVNGDDETALGGSLTVSRATGEDVGDYTITASGYTSSNYTINYASGTFEITPAALTVMAADQSKVYGSADPAMTVSYAGFVNGDDETALGGSLTVSRATGEDVGDYAITASGHISTNYTINYASGTFEITPAALTVTAADQAKVYGSADPALTVTYAGFVNGDDAMALGGSLTVSRAAGEDVGDYAITASGYTSTNYTITYAAGTFEITPAALTVMAADQSKVYGSADPAMTVSYAGFVNGDDETALGGSLTVSRATGEDVGDYTITASGYTSSNYTINYASGTFEITPAALTVTAEGQSKVYGSMDPALTVTYAGFVNGDDAMALGGSLTVSRAAGEDVGDYAITASGYTSTNYTINYASGTFEITPAAMTVTVADHSKVYGSVDPAMTVTYAGFVNGDDETALGGSLKVTRATGEDVGDYTITASGYTSMNYTITYTAGTFAIIPAVLTVTANDHVRIFGASDPRFTYQVAGLVNGDGHEIFEGQLERAPGEGVGAYAINKGSLSAGRNYQIQFTSALLTIKAIEVVAFYEQPAVAVAWGTASDQIPLPTEVLVRTRHDEMINLAVEWDRSSINVRSRGSYTVTGELNLPEGVTRTAEGPFQQVVVEAKPAPEDIVLDHDNFVADIGSDQIVVGGLSVIDPVDDQHTLNLVGNAKDNAYFSLSGTALFWSSGEALPGRRTFEVLVAVTDADGNKVEKLFVVNRLRVPLDEVTIYNTFTPNQDGANDTWGVPELQFYTDVRVMVFERSGNRVFFTDDPDEHWEGQFNGKEMAAGTYFWVIEVGETGEVRRGTLNLLRR
ncbi:MBG domain-containing protein [Echinicola vietnamensis]|uniref:Calx-beta domain-containing protein n=1 Tax=Echinicola vietnamensis (strain DSM 17526 / LMG 23754 / KMM 6221) TaxID=926556 RepID=L0G6T2_ECHVK|nr:MBG domain-containing protein [Echinicola vietnamensis]AGA80716.1 Calx-beta domain-containing protein [Echinicola vietnamensis DSM 17526]